MPSCEEWLDVADGPMDLNGDGLTTQDDYAKWYLGCAGYSFQEIHQLLEGRDFTRSSLAEGPPPPGMGPRGVGAVLVVSMVV